MQEESVSFIFLNFKWLLVLLSFNLMHKFTRMTTVTHFYNTNWHCTSSKYEHIFNLWSERKEIKFSTTSMSSNIWTFYLRHSTSKNHSFAEFFIDIYLLTRYLKS
jgi:hypothetical protein